MLTSCCDVVSSLASVSSLEEAGLLVVPLVPFVPAAAVDPPAAVDELAEDVCPELLAALLLPEPVNRLPIKSLTFGSTEKVYAARVTASH